MKKLTLLFLGLALVLVARPASANVFGKERRLPLLSARFPFDAVGMVVQTNLRGRRLESCTGTLVADGLVLTAAHCVASRGGDLDPTRRTWFLPRGLAGYRTKALAVWEGNWRRESDSRDGDWALILVENTGLARPKYLPVAPSSPAVGSPLVLVGYSADFEDGRVASVDLNCQVRGITPDGVIQHDCQSFAGASGGPLLGLVSSPDGARWEIVGVHAAHKSEGTNGLRLPQYLARFANLGSSSAHFADRLSWLRSEISARIPSAGSSSLAMASRLPPG